MTITSTTRRAASAVLGICAAFATLGIPAVASSPSDTRFTRTDAPDPESLDDAWEDCGDGYDCATMPVPLDHSDPAAGTIEVALTRHAATDPERRIGTLFIGYPLGSFDFVRGAPPVAWDMLPQFDVIGYDGRGNGPTQIDCNIDWELLEPFGADATRPGSDSDAAMAGAAEEIVGGCADAAAELLPHMSIADMARDLDLLREAAGDEQLTFAGISHGTLLGAAYASLFPGRVRAMVLDSPLDAAQFLDRPLETWREQFASSEFQLNRFFLACAANASGCSFGGADPEAAYDALLDRLDEEPIATTAPEHPESVDGDDVRLATFNALYGTPASWSTLADALAAADAGDGALIRALVDGDINDPTMPAFSTFLASVSVDQNFPSVEESLHEIRHLYAIAPHLWTADNFVMVVGSSWPVEPANPFTGDFEHDADSAPILVIGGTHDPATPFAWAERLVADLGNARLLTYEGDGHGALTDFNGCVLGAALPYLADPAVVPAAGTVCEQEIEPFAQ